MARSSTKAARLLQIETLMMAHPEGLTPAEIARHAVCYTQTEPLVGSGLFAEGQPIEVV